MSNRGGLERYKALDAQFNANIIEKLNLLKKELNLFLSLLKLQMVLR